MLAYSGRGQFVIERINLGDLVSEMVHLLNILISKKAVLSLHLAENIPLIEGDATQIRQILMNLITNASEAIGDHDGAITIATGSIHCSKKYFGDTVIHEELKDGLYVYLEVSDTGCGMDKETQRRIFDPFFTTKFTGRGLGMAAVLGIVKGHKGAIRIYSETGKGTVFKIFFPSVENIPVVEDVIPMPNTMQWRGDGVVLLVDDEETIREMGKEMLEMLGFEIITGVDGFDAVRIYKEQKERIDFVLLDLTMPRMDGKETFHELRRLNPQVRIVLSSGYAEQDITSQFAGQGLSGFIQKPYTLGILEESMQKLLLM